MKPNGLVKNGLIKKERKPINMRAMYGELNISYKYDQNSLSLFSKKNNEALGEGDYIRKEIFVPFGTNRQAHVKHFLNNTKEEIFIKPADAVIKEINNTLNKIVNQKSFEEQANEFVASLFRDSNKP